MKVENIIVFDCETNSLLGAAFAVGAITMDSEGNVLSEFVGRCPIEGPVDPWVAQNVLPGMQITENFGNGRELRDTFWAWLQTQRDKAAEKEGRLIVIADNGYPVEAGFLLACQRDDFKEREFKGPFPLIDCASLQLACGLVPHQIHGEDWVNIPADQRRKHDPRYDAWVSGLCAIKALKQLGQM